MTAEKLREHLRRQPFHPFRVFLSDGSKHDVRHPEMAFLTRREIIIAVSQDVGGFPERTVICDLLHVTRIEPIDGKNGSRRSKTQS